MTKDMSNSLKSGVIRSDIVEMQRKAVAFALDFLNKVAKLGAVGEDDSRGGDGGNDGVVGSGCDGYRGDGDDSSAVTA